MNTQALQQQFVDHASSFCKDPAASETVFTDLLKRYAEPHRHYHTLAHITMLLQDAEVFFNGRIPAELFFAIWFHDAIYSSTSSKNEEQSAELAREELTKLGCPSGTIEACVTLIHKTADHFSAQAQDEITQFFMDADLKILGSDGAVYQQYVLDVRKEYSSIPSILFNIGRRKFLRKALASERIFRTQIYYNVLEQAARNNLQNELNQLT